VKLPTKIDSIFVRHLTNEPREEQTKKTKLDAERKFFLLHSFDHKKDARVRYYIIDKLIESPLSYTEGCLSVIYHV